MFVYEARRIRGVSVGCPKLRARVLLQYMVAGICDQRKLCPCLRRTPSKHPRSASQEHSPFTQPSLCAFPLHVPCAFSMSRICCHLSLAAAAPSAGPPGRGNTVMRKRP